MCTIKVTHLSNKIADSLSKLILADVSTSTKNKYLVLNYDSGLSISQEIARVSMYLIELICLQEKNENDKNSIRSVLEISIPQIQRIINQLGEMFNPLSEIEAISNSLNAAVTELDKLEWGELKISLIILFSTIYI